MKAGFLKGHDELEQQLSPGPPWQQDMSRKSEREMGLGVLSPALRVKIDLQVRDMEASRLHLLQTSCSRMRSGGHVTEGQQVGSKEVGGF